MERLFDVFYKDSRDNNKEKSVRYCCVDKSQARRLFYSESPLADVIVKVKEVK